MATDIMTNARGGNKIDPNDEAISGLLEIYDDLLSTIWSRVVPTLGTITLVTIIEKSISRTAKDRPLLKHLTVGNEGCSFLQLRAVLSENDREELRNSFKDLIGNLFEILAKLTGNILVQQLSKEVEGLELGES